MLIKAYLMVILDNYMFRPLLAIFRLSSRELKVWWQHDPNQEEGRATRLFILPAHPEPSNRTLATRHYHATSHSIPPHIEITLRNKARM